MIKTDTAPMGTNTFLDVIDMVLVRIKDVKFADYSEEDLIEELGIQVKMVIAKARVFKNLSYNPNKEDFNRKLTDMECLILATGLSVEWLAPRIYNYELLETQIGSKNFNQLSNANLLREIRGLFDDSKYEFNQLVSDFDYDAVWASGDMSCLI